MTKWPVVISDFTFSLDLSLSVCFFTKQDPGKPDKTAAFIRWWELFYIDLVTRVTF